MVLSGRSSLTKADNFTDEEYCSTELREAGDASLASGLLFSSLDQPVLEAGFHGERSKKRLCCGMFCGLSMYVTRAFDVVWTRMTA